ncbi:MAG: ribosome silencing factor [Phycisphaerales bacterium]|jgi:ribosome-associated protein|nr:ribosome silencing factor [Phycisphaerales bacterium]
MSDPNSISAQAPEPGSGAAALTGEGLSFAIEAARLAVDRHCTDVRIFDVRGRSQVCDYVVVASGTSDRQVRSVAGELEDVGQARKMHRLRTNADPASTWVVVDFVDVVVHLFEPSRRAYYDIDELWSNAPEVEFDRDAAS